MRTRMAGGVVLTTLALACVTVWADDSRKPPPPEDPDPGFLEFLGSVDRLSEVNPDYLAQAARPAGAPAPKPAPPPPPPPPPRVTQGTPGVNNNDQ